MKPLERRTALIRMRILASKHFPELVRILEKEIWEENNRNELTSIKREYRAYRKLHLKQLKETKND